MEGFSTSMTLMLIALAIFVVLYALFPDAFKGVGESLMKVFSETLSNLSSKI
ncbi:hypothetical protein ACQKM9_17400 [Viridibacillus sp. NPDC093762]|uniref:hypothetical protein n=1 Tax=Viridibacillus sp. NPDC093762 TaxID=3390720 RepID=UPI003CFCBE19